MNLQTEYSLAIAKEEEKERIKRVHEKLVEYHYNENLVLA
jgi:plasmid maintenance system antidote protein VapI